MAIYGKTWIKYHSHFVFVLPHLVLFQAKQKKTA